MFTIYNPETKQKEIVSKIDYKKHWHLSGVPFERDEPETEENEEEIVEKPTKRKKK